MSSEYYNVNESILTEEIGSLQVKDLILVSDEADVSDVCLEVLTEGERVVENEDHFPLGVLDRELAANLITQEGSLSQYLDCLDPIAFCTPDTQILTLMYAVHELGSIPWFVLKTEQTFNGLVAPSAIFNAFAKYFRSQQRTGKSFWIDLRRNRSLTYPSLIDPVIPNPGPPNCYCCPFQLNSHKPHRLQHHEIKRVDSKGNYLCPKHPGQRVSQSINGAAC